MGCALLLLINVQKMKLNTKCVSILPIKAELKNRKGGSNMSPWNFSITKIYLHLYILLYESKQIKKSSSKKLNRPPG